MAQEESSEELELIISEVFEREEILNLQADSISRISRQSLQRVAQVGILLDHPLSMVLGEVRKVVQVVEARELDMNLSSTLLATHPSSLSRRDQQGAGLPWS